MPYQCGTRGPGQCLGAAGSARRDPRQPAVGPCITENTLLKLRYLLLEGASWKRQNRARPGSGGAVEMDWQGWALFGLLATTALTAVMIACQMAGWTRLDLPLVLGTLVTPDPD